ncbi:MAG: thioredoxin family protein [Spirochaetales bacterium]|nr:thioredoxin family protein [Spirochaetales bacterium]
MKRKQSLTVIFIIISMLMVNLSVSARGSSEISPEPEPVMTKTSDKPSENDSKYPPRGWVTDILEAYKTAQAEDKQILINFTGSDWCVWCKKLSKEVFLTGEFKEYADKNLVLLFLDFPSGINLSEEQVFHNQLIAQLMNVKGYPAIWLMDKDLNPLMATGYREGGAKEYIRHLRDDLPDVSQDEKNGFRLAFIKAIEANLGPLK